MTEEQNAEERRLRAAGKARLDALAPAALAHLREAARTAKTAKQRENIRRELIKRGYDPDEPTK